MYFVYILRTSSNTLYVGITNNLEKRMRMHERGKGSKYMRSFTSFELVYKEKYETRSEALVREQVLKKLTHMQKEALILTSKVE